jgi:hypothetical protein
LSATAFPAAACTWFPWSSSPTKPWPWHRRPGILGTPITAFVKARVRVFWSLLPPQPRIPRPTALFFPTRALVDTHSHRNVRAVDRSRDDPPNQYSGAASRTARRRQSPGTGRASLVRARQTPSCQAAGCSRCQRISRFQQISASFLAAATRAIFAPELPYRHFPPSLVLHRHHQTRPMQIHSRVTHGALLAPVASNDSRTESRPPDIEPLFSL